MTGLFYVRKMKKYRLQLQVREILGDMLTPVGIYLAMRDQFPNALLLESSDYHGDEHTYSYICLDAIAGFKVENGTFMASFPKEERLVDVNRDNITQEVEAFLSRFEPDDQVHLPFIHRGLFGYMSYEAIQLFEDISLQNISPDFPLMQYGLYRYIIAFNHTNHTLSVVTTLVDEEELDEAAFDRMIKQIRKPAPPAYTFRRDGEKRSNLTDEEFISNVQKGIQHCFRGDVFQIVLSRMFKQGFRGDDFNVYRALRSINPSPYLFYFDMGSFRIFGSSPEAQLIIKSNKVTIHPIAGTFRRTGDDARDLMLAKELSEDPKENAEHIMLVDLARNDLSRCGKDVQVEVFREVQFYSHVIHLVSKVTATMHPDTSRIRMVGDTFPAGTVSGAPKYKAMELIDQLENTGRGFYAGAIGHMDFTGEYNHAIMIRTFLSKDNELSFRAGAGVVADSKPESELQEVENKLMALNKAIVMAENI
jgi:anthranilate synthase component I